MYDLISIQSGQIISEFMYISPLMHRIHVISHESQKYVCVTFQIFSSHISNNNTISNQSPNFLCIQILYFIFVMNRKQVQSLANQANDSNKKKKTTRNQKTRNKYIMHISMINSTMYTMYLC